MQSRAAQDKRCVLRNALVGDFIIVQTSQSTHPDCKPYTTHLRYMAHHHRIRGLLLAEMLCGSSHSKK